MSVSARSSKGSRPGLRHVLGVIGSGVVHLALFFLLLRPIHATPVAPLKPVKPPAPELAMSCDFPATTPASLRADAPPRPLRLRNHALLDVRIGYDGKPVDVRLLSGTGDGTLDQLAICATSRRTYGAPNGLAWLASDRLLVPVAFPSGPM